MGVDRTDYLMWGAKVHPDAVDYDRDEAAMGGGPDAPFDMVYDAMSGHYAVAGKIIAKADGYNGELFQTIHPDQLGWDVEVVSAVRRRFPDAEDFALHFFTHYH